MNIVENQTYDWLKLHPSVLHFHPYSTKFNLFFLAVWFGYRCTVTHKCQGQSQSEEELVVVFA